MCKTLYEKVTAEDLKNYQLSKTIQNLKDKNHKIRKEKEGKEELILRIQKIQNEKEEELKVNNLYNCMSLYTLNYYF